MLPNIMVNMKFLVLAQSLYKLYSHFLRFEEIQAIRHDEARLTCRFLRSCNVHLTQCSKQSHKQCSNHYTKTFSLKSVCTEESEGESDDVNSPVLSNF